MELKEIVAHLMRMGAQELNDLATELEAQKATIKITSTVVGDGDNDVDDGGIGQDDPLHPDGA